jgi:uncharacterized membrane protein
MHKVQRTIDIKAPVQRVYDFIAQPTNLPGIWPSMVEVSNVVTRSGDARDFDWVYKMAGVRLKGHTTTEETRPGAFLRTRTEGAIQSTFRWTFKGLDGMGTKLTCEVEYTIPVPVLGKIGEALVAKLNEREMETTLANLKDVMEHGTAGIAASAPAH